MKTILIAASAAAIALSAGLACAAQTGPGPKQPIPYAQLGSYMKASPKARASKDWWSGQTASADTGASANTSATAANPSSSLPADTSAPATSANPPSLGGDTKEAAPQLPSSSPADAVNPPAAAAPGAPASTTPPK
jgi:hypothetical protein